MSELGFGNKSDFYLKIASLGLLLVWFLVEIWSDKSLILRFLGLIFCLVALERECHGVKIELWTGAQGIQTPKLNASAAGSPSGQSVPNAILMANKYFFCCVNGSLQLTILFGEKLKKKYEYTHQYLSNVVTNFKKSNYQTRCSKGCFLNTFVIPWFKYLFN